jgi:NAD(P)-dependent dehydrogenase (short-subunit alcohol dehydrogenase family)
MLVVYRITAGGPVLVVRHYLDLLAAGRARVLNLSSLVGSVSHKTGPGDYAYAGSKAALNIMTRTLAAELAPKGIIPIAITPGWVRTEMGGARASLTPEESVRGMLQVAARLTPRDAGHFVDYQGETQPW